MNHALSAIHDAGDIAVSPPEYIHSIRLVAGLWKHSTEYEKMLEWINNHDGCQLDLSSGWCIINSNIFYTTVKFINEEDKLAFSLIFCDLVR